MNTLPGYHHRQKPPLGAQLLTGHPLAQGLKCFFPLSEAAGGFASDLAQSAPSQPFVGGSPWGSNGLVYTGATRQYFLAAAQSTLTSAAYLGPLTMAVWCSNANKNTTEINPLCLTYSGNTTPLFQFRLNSGVAGKVDIFGRNNAGTGATAASLANVWNDGKLHLLAAVWTGATLSLYIDGVFQSSAAFSGGVQLDRTCVGVRYYGSSFGNNFVGTISQAAVYNRALTPGEVEQLYDDPYQMVAPPALWRLAAVQAAGGVTLNATGSPTAQAATVSGAASVPLNAAGSASAQAATGLGAASVPLNAAGAASAGSATASGAASVPLNAAGAVNAQSATATGAVSVPLNAGGSVSSQAATAAGAGTVSLPGINADGAVTPAPATSAGLASIPLSALGYMTARPATAAGAVSIPVNAAGAVFARAAAASGAGTIVQGPTVRRYYFVRAGRVYIVKGK